MNPGTALRIARDTLANIAPCDVRYVAESAPWSVQHDGENLVRNARQVRARLTTSPWWLRSRIVHFGSANILFSRLHGSRAESETVKPTGQRWSATWFHVAPDDPRLVVLSKALPVVDLWHTSCRATEQTLIRQGVPAERLRMIPLGVDTDRFCPLPPERKASLRRELGIPDNAFAVGSFQKDGVGWGQGLEPKGIKGPDVLCDALEQLAKLLGTATPVFAVLTGPARGYVKKRLERAGIPFLHATLPHADRVAPYVQACDACCIASRVEGGPKALLEAMACGVPVVSTSMGMAADIVTHGANGLLTEIDDAEALARNLADLRTDAPLAETLASGGRETALAHDWSCVAERYEKELWMPLL